MTEPDIRLAYRDACPGIAGRIITEHEAAEADAMRAALVAALLSEAADRACAGGISAAWGEDAVEDFRRAAWATVLWLLLAPEAT